jgi:crotonobetainyl-CoA:carnitine CoA-transferase CaiB-like acyl-CoA transferase
VLTLHEAMAHPHLRQRGTVRRVRDPHIGEFDMPGLPVKFSGWQENRDLQADLLGEHNDAVLAALLGLSESEIGSLYEQGVLVRDALLDGAPAEGQRGAPAEGQRGAPAEARRAGG